MKLIVISDNYPRPGFVYGDVFVHARVKAYCKLGHEVLVAGYNNDAPNTLTYQSESVNCVICNDYREFKKMVSDFNTDVVAIHFLNRHHTDFLLELGKPVLVFVHGFGVTSWKRRLMNYRAPGDFPYLLEYIKSNRAQLKKVREFVSQANQRKDIRFVFVSRWIWKAAEHDLGLKIKNGHLIPNGIDTQLFNSNHRIADHRKKVLLLRSFKARNYANDIAVNAILHLSRKSFFNDLHFSLYGEGYLFARLTEKLKKFKNVSLHNFFIENKEIPALHKDHGIFLCPSRFDTQGVSMCEAMASGLVPITCAVGGIPEYTTKDRSSFMVSTAKEVADKIEYLYYHPEKFMEISSAARQEIMAKCDLSETVIKEVALMNGLIQQKNYYQQCTHCVLDTNDDPDISFDAHGVCNYCQSYKEAESKLPPTPEKAKRLLDEAVARIKEEGKGKKYDCILGLSGGVDSTYLALKAKELGLRPLAVHFDNGWNSELAVKNIESIISKLGFDLYTLVVDWEEFKDLQLCFIKASVIDIELITDHAIITTLHRLAFKYNIKNILSGFNVVTEFVLPKSWTHDKLDHIHIAAIHKKFGTVPLKTFPLFGSFSKFRSSLKRVKNVQLLNLLPYNKEEVKKIIQQELGWRDYGGKHYESIFTRFYQGYILTRKFKVDKRKAHLSNLICSGQMTRLQALEELNQPAYDLKQMEEDYAFVLKKFNLTRDAFEKLMDATVMLHTDFDFDQSVYKRHFFLRLMQPGWKLYKKFRGDK